MAEPVRASGTVHWLGTGLSTGSGLREVADSAARLVLWGRTADKATARLTGLGLAGRAEARAFDPAALAAVLDRGDIVVSMLPAGEHPALVRLCMLRGAHFACSSYVSDDLRSAARDASEIGVVVLTEAGLDPGIDHVLAHLLVADGRAAVGDGPATARFTSYCGGIPAVPNDFRYRFSWAPRGVLNALRAPARYIGAGTERTVQHPWEATRPHPVGGEAFEVYPNRDSLPFLDQYGIPPAWRIETFVRGTLRLAGWRDAWVEVFAELRAGDDNRIAALADRLAARYPTTEADRDRVVLVVSLDLDATGGRRWSGDFLLDEVGTEHESAMARCVSLPLAFGVIGMLAGGMSPGLRRAAESAAESRRWVAFLRERGVRCEYRTG